MIRVNDLTAVQEAVAKFREIMRSLNTANQQAFLLFIANNWRPDEPSFTGNSYIESNRYESPLRDIKKIVADIRKRMPFKSILQSENIIQPKKGENSDCDPKVTIHVDAFLYNNKELEELVDEGKLETLYCADCGSTKIKEYNIISHSMSVSAMLYVFENLLPPLEGKTLLDVGSRLGAVLYGAHTFTAAKRIIGVEMNEELCELQLEMIGKYEMTDRIEIVNKRVEDCPELVRDSDVIVLNNPFEFYVAESVHTEIWKFLRANIRRGTILVTRPSIETTLKDLQTGISIDEWVKPFDYEETREDKPQAYSSSSFDSSEYSDIKCYKVI